MADQKISATDDERIVPSTFPLLSAVKIEEVHSISSINLGRMNASIIRRKELRAV